MTDEIDVNELTADFIISRPVRLQTPQRAADSAPRFSRVSATANYRKRSIHLNKRGFLVYQANLERLNLVRQGGYAGSTWEADQSTGPLSPRRVGARSWRVHGTGSTGIASRLAGFFTGARELSLSADG